MEDCCIISTSFPLSEEDFFFFFFLYAQTRFKVTPLAIVFCNFFFFLFFCVFLALHWGSLAVALRFYYFV
jgi:hypothetical protein